MLPLCSRSASDICTYVSFRVPEAIGVYKPVWALRNRRKARGLYMPTNGDEKQSRKFLVGIQGHYDGLLYLGQYPSRPLWFRGQKHAAVTEFADASAARAALRDMRQRLGYQQKHFCVVPVEG